MSIFKYNPECPYCLQIQQNWTCEGYTYRLKYVINHINTKKCRNAYSKRKNEKLEFLQKRLNKNVVGIIKGYFLSLFHTDIYNVFEDIFEGRKLSTDFYHELDYERETLIHFDGYISDYLKKAKNEIDLKKEGLWGYWYGGNSFHCKLCLTLPCNKSALKKHLMTKKHLARELESLKSR